MRLLPCCFSPPLLRGYHNIIVIRVARSLSSRRKGNTMQLEATGARLQAWARDIHFWDARCEKAHIFHNQDILMIAAG
ncbi:hypothetical protein FIBSPDRAFT_425724 [Athelia psychrophila]|uniref:Uncharacterized protein n=1 Tax=Athelia psychrophila TaxID=1759441 RepID=A0A166MQJ2_9AGAM|nr:hypothetical protein FIBSPDRAFT_467806 [Fibularhizoctonia sp. CBS 109695]KZP24210.1 hypothetical protein FIBSPDRAFT_425724 [Fibularhizoctonia sp. CBS 109695]